MRRKLLKSLLDERKLEPGDLEIELCGLIKIDNRLMHDLDIIFKKKPENLDSILTKLGYMQSAGFGIEKMQAKNGYTQYESTEATKHIGRVLFFYLHHIPKDVSWQGIDKNQFASCGKIQVYKGNKNEEPGMVDYSRKIILAKTLRDYYDAVLYHTVDNKVITN